MGLLVQGVNRSGKYWTHTFRYLDKAYAIHDVALTDIKTERNFDPLDADPRYATLLRRMGLPQ